METKRLDMGEEKVENDSRKGAVVASIDFHHPFKPYEIQETFMSTVYEVLERGGNAVGILESPTGTVNCPFLAGAL